MNQPVGEERPLESALGEIAGPLLSLATLVLAGAERGAGRHEVRSDYLGCPVQRAS